MSERRSSRPRKRVDYGKLSVDEDSDDDFTCGTPPLGPPQKKRNCPNDARSTRATTKQENLTTDQLSKPSPVSPRPSSSPREVECAKIPPALIEDKLKPILSSVLKSEKLLEARRASPEETAVVPDNADEVESENKSPVKPVKQKLGNSDASKATPPSSSSECEVDSETTSSDESEADSENFEPKTVKGIKSISTGVKDSEKKATNTSAGRKTMPLKSKNIVTCIPEASKRIDCRGKSHEITARLQCTAPFPQRDAVTKVAAAARLSANRIASSGMAGLRLGLSRNARVKSLHPAVKVGPH